MTEAEWMVSDDPARMLEAVRWDERRTPPHRASDRKLRLYVEACRLIAEPRTANWANKLGTPSEVMRGAEDWCRHDVYASRLTQAVRAALLRDIVGNPFRVQDSLAFQWARYCPATAVAQAAYAERQADGTLDPHRLLVLSDALEEAGLALETCPACHGSAKSPEWWPGKNGEWHFYCQPCRGTGHVGVLAHLRSPGPHVRGCWALDLILGKE